ncbi:hypothetical protein RJ55_05544 [Drechmeria coniospora]|nr:hypothetical protein RJ55_05544 [Drechmeria coniospora]
MSTVFVPHTVSGIPACRKRRHSRSNLSLPTDDASRALKQHREFPLPRFWDGLSKIDLTKNALREFNRRNRQQDCGNAEVTHTPHLQQGDCQQSLKTATDKNDCSAPVDPILRQCYSPCSRELKRFAAHGGPDLSDLRGVWALDESFSCDANFWQYSMPRAKTSSSIPSALGRRKPGAQLPEKSTEKTITSRRTGPYDLSFLQHLLDHGIYPDYHWHSDDQIAPDPENLDDIMHALRQRRASLSSSQFSDDKHKKFKRTNAQASRESQVVGKVMPVIEGKIEDTDFFADKVPFTNLDALTDGTLVSASPDLYYGARPRQLHQRVREELSGLVVPSKQADLPAAPNFFVEIKGKNGSPAVAELQICYGMALGERGQAALLSYRQTSPADTNQAHTLGCTYSDGTLKMYATYILQPSKSQTRPEYIIRQIDSWCLTRDPTCFREGATAYRNARDWARRKREHAILQANESYEGS